MPYNPHFHSHYFNVYCFCFYLNKYILQKVGQFVFSYRLLLTTFPYCYPPRACIIVILSKYRIKKVISICIRIPHCIICFCSFLFFITIIRIFVELRVRCIFFLRM